MARRRMEQLTLALDFLFKKDRRLYKSHLFQPPSHTFFWAHSLSRPLYDLETVNFKMKKGKKKAIPLKKSQKNAAIDAMASLSPPPPDVVDYNQPLRS